ncbi:MAG: methyltransferase domain-containing protein [Rhizomicrobium sp.]
MNSPPEIFDFAAYALRRERALRRGGDSFLLRDAAERLAERLGAVKRRFVNALDLQSRDESFVRLAPFAANWVRQELARDETLRAAPQSLDLVTSVLSLHAVNDLPGLLVQIRRALKPDGLFLAAVFSGETLHELREAFAQGEINVRGGASPRVAPLADLRDLGALLQRAGFALPVADSERTVVRYRAFETLVSDLRTLGETNALSQRSRKFLRRDTLAASLAHYRERHAEPDGRLRATFDIAYLTGWAPHESQQKPLKPGSAKTRLADALGTAERSAGDSASPIRNR